jgi:hypothetical protein
MTKCATSLVKRIPNCVGGAVALASSSLASGVAPSVPLDVEDGSDSASCHVVEETRSKQPEFANERMPGCGRGDEGSRRRTLAVVQLPRPRIAIGGGRHTAETRYGDPWRLSVRPTCTPRAGTLRQIGAELGVPWTDVGHQLRRTGVTTRRDGSPAHAPPRSGS